jgi:hypothetical protein
MVELAEIFRRHGPEYRARFGARMPPSHLAAMRAIEQCRTEALGGHLYQCTECGDLEYRYHSCKNRHCPKCQNGAATRWLAQQRALLLPVPYFLVTFTLPEELRPVARSHQTLLYNLLFQTSAAALKALALDPKYLGGQIGMVGVLHTWTREMAYHPHVHYLVPGGALAPDGAQWLAPHAAQWLVPVHALSKVFRGKFQAALTTARLRTPVPPQVWHKGWVTHCAPAGTGTEVLSYFAPYIYRIAITTNRLETLEDGHVTFRVKERQSQQWQHRTLPAEEFIRRFLQHVLPKGFSKVRYYGILSPHSRPSLGRIRRLLAASPGQGVAPERGKTQPPHAVCPAQEQERRCQKCGGPLVFLWPLTPPMRGPP